MNDEALKQLGWRQIQAEAMRLHGRKGLLPGRVIATTRDFCTLLTGEGEPVAARIPGRLHHLKRRVGGLLPVVGDWVVFKPAGTSRSAVVEEVLPRQTCLSRQAPGRRGRLVEQVIAANVDTVFVITGLDQDFNPRRIERYLALVSGSGARAVVLLNKADLCSDPEPYRLQVEAFGCPVVILSAEQGTGLDALSPFMKSGDTIAMLGSSGVGKSTLINRLMGEDRQQVATVSESDGKGRHTTTHRELLRLPGGVLLMDNPGMRELQLWKETASLEEAFEDIFVFARDCRFSDCRHLEEPDCSVKQAVAEGRLAEERFQSFLKLQQELIRHGGH